MKFGLIKSISGNMKFTIFWLNSKILRVYSLLITEEELESLIMQLINFQAENICANQYTNRVKPTLQTAPPQKIIIKNKNQSNIAWRSLGLKLKQPPIPNLL